jgi:hypothetical protein
MQTDGDIHLYSQWDSNTRFFDEGPNLFARYCTAHNNLNRNEMVDTTDSLAKSDKFMYQTNRHQVGHRAVTSLA